MRRVLLVAGSVLTTICLAAAPASAGGWWNHIGVDGQPFGIGESVSLTVRDVWFPDLKEAHAARDVPYYAYLVEAFDEKALERAMSRPDPEPWWEPSGRVFRIGDVSLTGWDSNIARARVQMTVPEVEPGSYALMLCDAGCRTPLGNIVPAPVRVTQDVLAAQTARRLDRVRDRLRFQLARIRHDLREARGDLEAATTTADSTSPRTPEAVPDSAPPVPWPAFAGWFFAGVATAALLGAVLHRRFRVISVPRDARDLVDAPREPEPSRKG
ncbi:MAG TPA: hypothetical protein VM573_00425 [Actinomycetota bacterium]|nr:hypothetical protein [Actinomycetota bacterium]